MLDIYPVGFSYSVCWHRSISDVLQNQVQPSAKHHIVNHGTGCQSSNLLSLGMVTRLPPCAMPDPLFSEEIPLNLQPEPLGAALVCDLLSCHCLPGRRDRPPAGYRLLKGRWRGW